MTRDDVIRMARESGFRAGHIELYGSDPTPFVAPSSATDCMPKLVRFAAIVAAAEREACKAEVETLRAKIEEMEKQEPVGEVVHNGESAGLYDILEQGALLYSLPGAQPTPSIPEGWLRAIDEALVVAHIGVASTDDTYEQAKAKLDNLIGFHVDVATDPAVNGGWKLVPTNPTETFYQCFSAYDGTSYSNPFDYDDFVKDWREALAAAPEAKP